MIDLLNCAKRVDCPECDASYCQECDFLNQNQGKLHVDHPLPIVFYTCSYITLWIYACIGILFILVMLLSYLPVFENRGSCSFAMLCRRGWFVYSLSLCEDYIYLTNWVVTQELTHLWAEVVLLGVEGRHHGVLHLFLGHAPMRVHPKWNAAQAQKDQTDLVTSSFHVRPLAIWALD